MDAPEYLLLPWRTAAQPALSDAEYRTYLLILSLAWQHDRHQTPPIGRKELAALRGLALRTVDAHLRSLRAKGYVRNAPGREGLKLILIPTALEAADVPAPERSPAALPPSAPPSASPCSPHEGPRPAEHPGPLHGRPRAATPPASPPAGPDDGAEKDKLYPAKGKEELLAISNRLRSAGVYPVVAARLAGEPWVSLELVEAWIGALRQRPHVRQLGGLLAAILRKPETCLPAPSAPPPPPAHAGREEDEGPPPEAPDEEGEAEEDESPPSPFPQDRLPWERVLALLRQRLGEEPVRVWLGGSAPLGLAEGRLIIALRSPLGADWVQKRYWRQIQEAVEEVAGRPLELRFVVAKEAGAPREEEG